MDILSGLDNGFLMSAGQERAGRYDVVVQKIGYQEWRETGVRVGKNTCGVEPVTLRANLQREL